MGQRILELAGQQSKDWARFAGASDLKLAVNVSARQFHQPQFVDLVSSILRRTGSLPGRLKLEITESVVLINMEDIIRKMRILLDEGLSFALDDFGTGYSSLSYLKRLPVSQVKIDQSFVRDLNVDPNDAAIVRAILGMADSLGLQAIAEGVESEQQRDFLIENGCQAFQGYLFGKPLPADQFEARFLRRGKAAAVAETR